jgi:hypothetical protein
MCASQPPWRSGILTTTAEHARGEVDSAAGDHRRRVDQRRDRRRARHRIRQPDEEGYLRRLACRSDKEQQRNRQSSLPGAPYSRRLQRRRLLHRKLGQLRPSSRS